MSSQASDFYKGPDPRLADGNPMRLGQIDRSLREPVLLFFAAAVLWLLFGSVFGVISAIKLHTPQFLGDTEWLTFGITRALHLDSVVYGWAGNAIFGVSLWLMHRLCRVELEHSWVPVMGCLVWNVALVFGLGGIATGHMTGVEWLEMPKGVSPVLVTAFLMIGLWNIVAFARRKTDHVYVSQWYILAAMFWFPVAYCVAEMMILWDPARGAVQAVVNSWFGHNIIALWLAPMGIAAIYYFIPKVLGKPIHGYYLAIVGFWTFALFYGWAGVDSLVGGPIPVWMQSAGIVASVMMIIPGLVTAINFHCTCGGPDNRRVVLSSPTLHFIVFGAFSYTLFLISGALLGLRDVSAVTHFTDVTVGHTQLGVYAFLTMVLFGSIYFILPRLLYREWPSSKLIRLHFWLCAIGVLGYIVVMTTHGVLQGIAINNGADFKNTVDAAGNITIPGIAARSAVWNELGTLFGAMMLLGHLAFAVNLFRMLAGSAASRNRTAPALFANDALKGGAR